MKHGIRNLSAFICISVATAACSTTAVTSAARREEVSSPRTPAGAGAEKKSRVVQNGIAVELTMAPVGARNDVSVRFRVSNGETDTPLTGLHPIAWVDRSSGTPADKATCDAKITSFLSGSLQARPDADLNSYSIVTLNREGNITVIDPLLGFGGTKLLALVDVQGEPADWVLSRDSAELFVTVPARNELVAIDMATWTVDAHIAVGERPRRIGIQPDGAYLWVANSGVTAGSVSVINVAERREVARIAATAGEHELQFSADSRYAFVTMNDGTVAVVDVRTLKPIRSVATGQAPVAIAYSPLSNALYVGHEDGSVAVVDASTHEIRSRVTTTAGLRSIGVTRDGRYAFTVNSSDSTVSVIDTSSNRITQTFAAGVAPDQVSFTDDFAYVRSVGTGDVTLVRLASVGEGQQPAVTRFPGGQIAPEYASGPALPAAIVAAPEKGAVLVSNPADKTIYYYAEGMAAPMGSFQNYKREPLGVLAVNRSLREVEPGVYATTVRLDRGGRFDVPFLSDTPKFTTCFDSSLHLPIDKSSTGHRVAVHMERMFPLESRAGQPLQIRVRLTDAKSGAPLNGLRDLGMLSFSPALFQKRELAKFVGEGVYEVTLVPPATGVYYLFFQSSSLERNYQELPHWIVQATEKKSVATATLRATP